MKCLLKVSVFAILAFMFGLLHAQATGSPPNAPSPVLIDGVAASSDWRLPEGHFVSAKMPMRLVHPRPDIETNAWARHRKAYPGLEYRIPISIQGGAYPFFYEIVEGPSWLSIGQQYGGNDYGILHGVAPVTPQDADMVKITVTDQDLTTVEVTFQLTVTANGFIFVDGSIAEAGNGTIGSPLKRFADIHGDYYPGSGSLGNPGDSSGQYAGKIVYFRAGTYFTADIPTPSITWSTNQRPYALLGYPGEDVELNFRNGKLRAHGATDLFVGGMRFKESADMNLVSGTHWSNVAGRTSGSNSWLYAEDDSWSMENSSRMFRITGHRITFFELQITEGREAWNNTHSNLRHGGNSGVTFYPANRSAFHEYHTYWDVDAYDHHSTIFGSIYTARYGVAEKVRLRRTTNWDNSLHGSTIPNLVFLKSTTDYWSLRRNEWTETPGNANGGGMLFMLHGDRFNQPYYVEFAYNLVHSPGLANGRTIWFAQTSQANNGGSVWVYRNTIIGATGGTDNNYTVVFENNVSMLRNGTHPTSGSNRVVLAGDDLVDSTDTWTKYLDDDYRLKGGYREEWLGRRGHEIAP